MKAGFEPCRPSGKPDSMHLTSQIRPYLRAPLGIAAGLLALLCGVALATGQAQGAAAGEERPSFVVIQTDDETLDGLYATFNAYGGAPATRAMPNTIDLLAKRGMTFNRYYVSYPLCCPSRTSLLTGRYAHNHNVRGNVPPEGGFTGFSIRKAFSHNIATWLQGAGYRTIHVGKFLNGYGDEPFDNGTTVPPGWSAWHSVLKADTDHYYYGYRLNNNGAISPPYGDSGSWDTREYGVRDDPGCPLAPLNGLPCLYATDVFTSMAAQEIEGTSPTRPFYLQLDYTAPHGDFRRPAGPEPAPRHYDWFWGAKVPHDRSEGLNEGNANDKPSFIRNAPYLSGTELRIYRVYWEKQLDSLRSIDDGVKAILADAGQDAAPPQHLHRLHLRQRLLLRRAPPRGRQVPRLRAGDPPAADNPGAGDPTEQRHRRAGGEHRHRPDRARAGRRQSGPEHRRSLAGPLPGRLRTAHSPPDPLRVLRPDQGRRSTRRPRHGEGRAARPTPRSSPRPRTTRGSASAPTSTSPGRPGRKSSTTSTRTPTS